MPAGPSSTPVALVITLRGHTGAAGTADDSTRVELHARCASPCECPPQTVYATTPSGPGCVSASAATALAAFVDQLAAPPLSLVEPRPLPATPASVTLVDASQLVLSPPAITLAGTTTPADPARIEELVTVLGLPATPAALPTTAPSETLATPASTLRLYANDVVARAGEPVALQLGPGAAAILRRPGAAYRDLTLWREDPLTIHAITIQRAASRTAAASVSEIVRGAVIGEWTRDGAPLAAPEAELAEALASSLAAPRVLGDAAHFPPRYVVTIAVAAPTGATASHSLTVGAPRSGCPLHALETDRLMCARLAALAR